MTLRQNQHEIEITTTGKGFFEINRQLARWLATIEAGTGLLTLFIRHTSASLIIQENADPAVLLDLGDALEKMAPQRPDYRHASEGPDDMPSHIKGMLTQTNLSIPVDNGRMGLGEWQGIFVAEHRSSPHTRRIILHYTGS